MLNREQLRLEWVTDGFLFSSQCKEVGTNGTSMEQDRIPMVSTTEGSHMCCWQAKTVPPSYTLPNLPCEVGDTSKWECFKSSKLTSALFIFQSICFRLIFGGLCSTFSFIFFLLQPWEKYKTKQMNNHKICWIWIPI